MTTKTSRVSTTETATLTTDSTATTSADLLPSPVRGDPDADVVVAAYVDFECPHCRSYELDVLPKVESEYIETGKIRYEHHDFPVPVDVTRSWEAANAARAVQDVAGDEAFWEFSHALFENQVTLSRSTYREVANSLGLDADAVVAAAKDRAYQATIEADKRRAKERGVWSTPTVFVNDDNAGNPSFSTLEIVIEEHLSSD